MRNIQHRSIKLFIIAASLFAGSIHAETKSYQPTAPKPPQLASAKTVFISNDTAALMADSDKLFDELYSSIQNQGRFTIVPNPADADLVLQYSFSYTSGSSKSVTLRVLDRKTLVILWSVTDQGVVTALDGTHGKKNPYDIIDEINDYLKIVATSQSSTN